MLPSRSTFTAASPWRSRSLLRNTSAIPPRPMRFSTSKRPPSTAPAMSSPRSGNTVHPFVWCAVVAGASGGSGVGGGVESVMAFPAYKEGVSEKIKAKLRLCARTQAPGFTTGRSIPPTSPQDPHALVL